MEKPVTDQDLSPATLQRAGELFAEHKQSIYRHTDRLFAVLMGVQWVAGILAALWITPRTWVGSSSQTHIHVWAAIFLGGAINIFPIVLAIKKPGAATTRYAIATGQVLMSALLIHLTGGRIETHFHVFGSLAFLAFYRDWRVLLPATIIVAADHFLRGIFWPESVYGVLSAGQWRWLEHAGWVLFEDAVLFVAIKRSVSEMWDIAVRRAETTDLNQSLERRVAERTTEIVQVNDGLQREIADRKQAETALRDSEERYRLLFESNPLPMWVYDTETLVFLAVNEAACCHYGYSRQEFLAMTLKDIRPPEDVPALLEHISKTGKGLYQAGVWKHRKKDGTTIDVEITSHAVDFADRLAKVVLVNDITERKLAEQALQEANERALTDYEQLVERIAALGQTLGNARDLSIIFRALRDFAVVSVPCDGIVISLYEQERGTRRPAYCWVDNREFDPQDLAEIPVKDGMTGRAIRSGSVIIDNDFQQQIRATPEPVTIGAFAGGEIPRSALSAPMTVMGRTIGCVEVQSYVLGAYTQEHATAMRMAANLAATALENVHLIEREQAKEEQLRQSQKMEAVGQLAGGVAHDFNNLLTAITGYSELTLRDLADDSPLRSRITEIKKAGDRAASLTRQLLAFSRKQILQPKVLDLNAVIPETDKMLRRLLGENIVLQTVLDDSLGQVKADPGQIEQILMNLSINARDAMPSGGRLTIETANVHLDRDSVNKQAVLRAGNYVMLSVSDNGCGMDDETQAQVFEPFFTTKEVGKGTGLGLSTVYGIVKQSEGSIWLYSEVGRGTTFKIYLPRIDEADEVSEQPDRVSSAPRGNETVLLVEDEDIVRILSTEILERQGYTVVAAANGEEGLRACKEFEGRIDLMITDVVMPHIGGRELAEQVALLRPDTRVLFMSGFTDDAIVRHGVLDKGVFFIQKPFSPDALARKARQVLDQSHNQPGIDSGLISPMNPPQHSELIRRS